jgi:tryptophan synthase alpha chain
LADGPVIQRATARALASGTRVADVLECAASVTSEEGIGVVLMTYVNPVLAYGWERFARDAARAGCLGVLLTDVPSEEMAPFLPEAAAQGLGTVCLVAPTSGEERVRRAAESTTGFLYCVSRLGITGTREALSNAFRPVLETVRRVSDLPVALGFGISTPDHAREAGALADGVVVGSAFVRAIEEAKTPEAAEAALERAAAGMRAALEPGSIGP